MLIRAIVTLLVVCLVAACAGETSSQGPAFLPVSQVLRMREQHRGDQVAFAGYLYSDSSASRLVDRLTFSAGPVPQPIAEGDQLWLPNPPEAAMASLRTANGVRFGLVVARGRLEGPGAYGPQGSYRYQLVEPEIMVQVAQSVGIAALTGSATVYQDQFVRVAGTLLNQQTSAILVDRVGPGGVPAPGSRQVKLAGPLDDTTLLQRLKESPNGTVRFGPVEVEGFWRDGVLTPLSIIPSSQ